MISELSGISRRSSLLLNLVLITVLSLPAILGYSTLSGIQPLGDGSTIMDLEDFLVSSNLLPLGSLTIALFCVKKNGWGWENFSAEVNTGEGKRLPDCLRGYMTYIVPAVICFIYLKGYYDTFAGSGTLTLFLWMTFAVVLLALVFAAAFTRRGSAAESARRAVEEQ